MIHHDVDQEAANTMSVLNRIAHYQGRRDEVPNQELARELAGSRDSAGIAEIAGGLRHADRNVQSDCLKVLYEIGYLAPELIADYVGDFLALLRGRNNRLVWGGMIALGTIAGLRPKEIWDEAETVAGAMRRGTLITVVWGVRTLARVAAADEAYRGRLFPILMGYLRTCGPREVPTHAESMLCAVDDHNRGELLSLLAARQDELTTSQRTRLRRALRQL